MRTERIISETVKDSRLTGRVRKFNRILSKKREEFNRAKKLEIANQAILANVLLNESCDSILDVIEYSLPKQEPSKTLN